MNGEGRDVGSKKVERLTEKNTKRACSLKIGGRGTDKKDKTRKKEKAFMCVCVYIRVCVVCCVMRMCVSMQEHAEERETLIRLKTARKRERETLHKKNKYNAKKKRSVLYSMMLSSLVRVRANSSLYVFHILEIVEKTQQRSISLSSK